MKRSIVLGAAMLLLGSTAASAFESNPRVDRRQDRQDWRIQRGIDEGSLTQREAKSLRRGVRQIERLERMALTDGDLHPAEVDLLLDSLDDLSDRIYRAKHNDRLRYQAKRKNKHRHAHKREWDYYGDRSYDKEHRRAEARRR